MSERNRKPEDEGQSQRDMTTDGNGEPISTALLNYYAQERGYHHPIMNMTARDAILPPREGGVDHNLADLQE